MRTFLLVLVCAAVGVVAGKVQVDAFTKQPDYLIGTELDAAQQQKIAESEVKAQELMRTGVIAESAIPKVEVIGGTDYDFGTMKVGTSRSHEFIFRNVGNAPLKLKMVGSTCKCTVGDVEEGYIEPGHETPVKLTWHVEGILQEFAQTATIETTDPTAKEVKLTITGKIGSTYVADPSLINLGDFRSSNTTERKFRVYSFENQPLKIQGYYADIDLGDLVQVELDTHKLEPGEAPDYADAFYVADGLVRFNPGMMAGPVNSQVRLTVGPDDFPMSIQVVGNCVSDLHVVASSSFNPERNVMTIGNVSAEDGVQHAFFIAAETDRQDVTLELEQIKTAELDEVMDAEIGTPIRTSTRTLFPVKLIIPPGSKEVDRDGSNPSNYGQVIFRSNLETSPKISIYIKVKVQ